MRIIFIFALLINYIYAKATDINKTSAEREIYPSGVIYKPLSNLVVLNNFMEQEIWKDIIGYEGLYQVSNWGRVKALETTVNHHYGKRKRRERIKAQAISTTGYYTVNLWKDNKIHIVKVHRAMMQVFKSNPENKKTVNHLDGIKLNNDLSNMEWATHKENSIHAHKNNLAHGAKGEDCGLSKLTNQEIIEIRILSENGIRHKILSKIFKVNEIYICNIVRRKTWNHI